MVGTGKGAEHGILIKSAQALETAHNIQTVVLDKTGTITQGKPVVTDVQTIFATQAEFISIAAALEEGSEHPLAEAVLTYAAEQQISAATSEQFQSLPGKGIQAKINGTYYYAGNRRLMNEKNIPLQQWDRALDDLATAGKTPLIFCRRAAGNRHHRSSRCGEADQPTSHSAAESDGRAGYHAHR